MDPEKKNEKYDATAVPRYSRDKFDAAMRSLKEQAEIVRRQMEAVMKVKEASDVVKEE